MRLAAFILALLLLAGAIEPTTGWLVILVVATGIAALQIHIFWPFSFFSPRPALDVRMVAFVLAVLLLAEIIEPEQGWLIALTAATGIAMVAPGIVRIDGNRGPAFVRRKRWERWAAWDGERFR